MIWIAIAVFALVALAPLAWALWGPTLLRSRRSAALDLHRAQLTELDRDLENGRIGAPEHAIAKLEVQRRLLAEGAAEEGASRSSRAPLVVLLILVPMAGVLLYLPGSAPNLPAAPLARRVAEQQQAAVQAQVLIGELQAKIAALDPHSDEARHGYILLGNLEDTRGDLAAAADAWSAALAIRFDAALAAQVAEAHSRVDGHVTPQSAALFRQALAAAPPDAPWRAIVQQRLASVSAAVPSGAAPPSAPAPSPQAP